MRVEIEDDPSERQGPQPVLYFEDSYSGPSISEIKQRLENGDPGIYVGVMGSKEEINICIRI